MPFWHPAVQLATWFGAGLLPVAPGSWASLAALPCAWAIHRLSGTAGLATATGAVFALGWWAATRLIKTSEVKDPGCIVIDEVAGQWLALMPADGDPLCYALILPLFRLFDIWKPWPVRWADRRVPGGLGIMLDDVLAAGYAATAISILLAIAGAPDVRR